MSSNFNSIELTKDSFQNGVNFIPIKNIIGYTYENFDRWKIVVNNLNSYFVTSDEIYNTDSTIYFTLDTSAHDAFAHWVFESAVWIPELLKLKQQIKNFKVLIQYEKIYKRQFLEHFNIDFDINPNLENGVILFPNPITSLNNPCVDTLYINLLENFHHLFLNSINNQSDTINFEKSEIRNINVLILPRQKKENLRANDREVDSSDIEKYLIDHNLGSIFETDQSPNLQTQIQSIRAAKYLIVPDGSAFLVNGFLIVNTSIIVLGAAFVPNQMKIYKKLDFIYSKIIQYNHVVFINNSTNVFTRSHVMPFLHIEL
jgi:hypothetical protein